MRRILAAVLVALALPLCVSCDSAAGDKQNSPDGFRKFWSDFRQATLAGDKGKVASLASFPFKTRGPLDSDPVKTYERAEFLTIFEKLLAQDPGLSREPETMRHFIERTAIVEERMLGNGGRAAKVGAFTFERLGGRWRFTQAYVEE